MLRIDTVKQHERMSTQDLLMTISAAVSSGETEFEIAASGQHDIGGPLWNPEGKKLRFVVSNPGQRLGCMGLDNTEITVQGSVPADAGWLNSGARIVIKGDAGDTAGHCAASGTIYIGGRAGTRSGSLMKHDPLYPEPELWILRNTGSFPCEFMGGGKMVVCGWDCAEFPSVLGERACTGMVGGTLYFRGEPGSYSASDVDMRDLDDEDREFLRRGLKSFLSSLGREELESSLDKWQDWRKLVPHPGQPAAAVRKTIREFHEGSWSPAARSGCACPAGTTPHAPPRANMPVLRASPRTGASAFCGRAAPKKPCGLCSAIPPSPDPYAAQYAPIPAWMPARAVSVSTCRCVSARWEACLPACLPPPRRRKRGKRPRS